MSRPIRALAIAVALWCCCVRPAAGQASPYISLDDPSLALVEHLIARGELRDPSPMIRPLRRADVAAALAEADTAGPAGDVVRRLRRIYTAPEAETAWRVEPRVGVQAFSQPRRDPLHPSGAEGVRGLAEVRAEAVFGNLVLVTRPAIEPRVKVDPDWPGRRDAIGGRLVEGYLAAQFRYVSLIYGQLPQNWGPTGLPGIPLSDYGYEREALTLDVGTRTVRLRATATELADQVDSTGETVHRYYFVHRLAVNPSERLHLAAWEGVVLAGQGRNFEARYRNPLSISYLANTVGLGDKGNVMLGLDARWRAFGRTTLEAQLAVDDFWYRNRHANRDRWAFTLGASGPAGPRLAWQARYTQVSSLALRAFVPEENFTDAGVGIGRTFTDMDRLTLRLSLPARGWLITPELALQRQGEGRIDAPYPPLDGSGRRDVPSLFIGTVERTWRAAVAVAGREGPLEVVADAGVHRIQNEDHQPGRSATRFEGRIQATLGLGMGGTLR